MQEHIVLLECCTICYCCMSILGLDDMRSAAACTTDVDAADADAAAVNAADANANAEVATNAAAEYCCYS